MGVAMIDLAVRMQRLRRSPAVRALMQSHRVHVTDLIMPLFVRHGEKERRPIASMPGCFQYSVDELPAVLDDFVAKGIVSVMLFGIPSHKDPKGSDALSSDGIIAQAIACIKAHQPSLWVIADTCFCEYTDHGHCGVVAKEGSECVHIDNDATLALLGKQAVVQATAGADCVAPSGMMDGMVVAIREALDQAGYGHVAIMSYAVKYASSFYGPFRDAAEGSPQIGDRRAYQMDPSRADEALREAALDIEEGADCLMVKPGMPYLDVVQRLTATYPALPMVVYQVSGEYAMMKAAAAQGWLDEKAIVMESLVAMKRAGARCIITYFAPQVATWLKEGASHGKS